MIELTHKRNIYALSAYQLLPLNLIELTSIFLFQQGTANIAISYTKLKHLGLTAFAESPSAMLSQAPTTQHDLIQFGWHSCHNVHVAQENPA